MVKVTKRGNSMGVNIHPDALRAAKIKENDKVQITVSGTKIIIEKVK